MNRIRTPEETLHHRIFAIGCLLLALGIGVGAFGAHGLQAFFDEYRRGVFEKGVFYHLIHAVGILIIALGARGNLLGTRAANRISLIFAFGTILFSGSLYLIALTGSRSFGVVTPFGGTLFLLGWILAAWETFRRQTEIPASP